VLLICDSTEAGMRSLSANAERFLQWRTIDGIQLDHLGQFNVNHTGFGGG
jgi:type I restriction enzyme, R subunit